MPPALATTLPPATAAPLGADDAADAVAPLLALDIRDWRPEVSATDSDRYAQALEAGGVLTLPQLGFALDVREQRFLDVRWSNGRTKNISLDGTRLRGAAGGTDDLMALAAMVDRFRSCAGALVAALFPRYAPWLAGARTSFRPLAASRLAPSWRKDDTRLHVDAFPSRPNRGRRILRVFCNVNPNRQDRVWRVGEHFEAMARRFLPRIRPLLPGESALLAALYVTRGRRSDYDHLMLNLHDRAKVDLDYQAKCPQREVRFHPGTTWICFSDQVMHAGASGQFMFEQTIHLPSEALYRPDSSPLAVLERITGRALVG
ncbi:MAG: Kdo hydroxylase family protein [Casimicrobiaceae bacterium]